MVETTSTYTLVANYDPTHTTDLRNSFVKEMNTKFDELISVIKKTVFDNNAFGIGLQTFQMNPAGEFAFSLRTNEAKLAKFMEWLQEQIDRGMIDVQDLEQIGSSVNGAWTNKYIFDSYKRGVIRARYELRKAGYNVPTIEESGGIEAALNTPFHIERIGLLFIRTFTDLKGITEAMDMQISRILAQGLADGDNPRLLARKIVAVINGDGIDRLGITDSLGRFIPAKTRAELLARTEIIRAHHLANVNEYKNWGVFGVNVIAEFKTAGDRRVCSRCEALAKGSPYTLDQVMYMIPVHPQCFIDPQVPIYTSNGWKPIGSIEVGDYVLTHKKRFKKVYALPRTYKQTPEVIKIQIDSWKKELTVTSNHLIYVIRNGEEKPRWIGAGECTLDDKVVFLASECKRCGKPVPYFKSYCSHSCLSKDITKKQWANEEHRKNVSEKNRESMLQQYKSGSRNGQEITKKAHEVTKNLWVEGNHVFQRPDVIAKMVEATNTPKHRAASSERMKKNNPMLDPVIRNKATAALLDLYENHPEKRLNARMAKLRCGDKKTWIEQRMADLLDKIGIDYIYQYPILKYNVDFAIPSLRIVIECDGEQWHQDKEKDAKRQERIEKEGWFVLRYTGTKINQCIDEIGEELIRVTSNHTGEYKLINLDIKSITRFTVKKSKTLYNLSVEEDESYIAKGFVVHNCRCVILPLVKN